MEKGVYKVIVCKNSGEEEFYIRLTVSGEFTKEEFVYDEFNFKDSVYIDPSLYLMLSNGQCVIIQDGPIDESELDEDILNSITENETFDMSSIQLFKSCSECNSICYGIMKQNGYIVYPNNSEDLAIYLDRVLKFEYDGDVFYGQVVSYKCYMEQKSEIDVDILEGCWSSFDEITNEEMSSDEISIETGREVEPDVLTKKCTSC